MTFRSASIAIQDAFNDTGHHFGAVATEHTIELAKPAGTLEGDILIAFFDTWGAANPAGFGTMLVLPPLGSTWTVLQNFGGNGIHHVLWKVAGVSEPSSWVFRFRTSTDTADYFGYATAIMGCWTNFTSPVVSVVNSQDGFGGYDGSSIVDIDSVTFHSAATTTGGFLVTAVSGFDNIENFDGTDGTGTGQAYPSVSPWVDIALQSPLTEHAQTDYNGTSRGAGEDASADGRRGTSYRTGNSTIAMGSQDLSAGSIPDSTVALTWQHAGNIFGYGENYYAVRLVVTATLVQQAYWGILHSQLT